MRSTSRSNLGLIINLRWLAILGQTTVILLAYYALDMMLNLAALFSLVGLLIIGNCISIVIKKQINHL